MDREKGGGGGAGVGVTGDGHSVLLLDSFVDRSWLTLSSLFGPFYCASLRGTLCLSNAYPGGGGWEGGGVTKRNLIYLNAAQNRTRKRKPHAAIACDPNDIAVALQYSKLTSWSHMLTFCKALADFAFLFLRLCILLLHWTPGRVMLSYKGYKTNLWKWVAGSFLEMLVYKNVSSVAIGHLFEDSRFVNQHF